MNAFFESFSAMDAREWIAQIIGFFAMGVAIVSFQQKSRRGILAFQFLSSLSWMVHMILLGALSGALLNVVGVVRCVVYYFREDKEWARHSAWQVGFVAGFAVMCAISFAGGEGAAALIPFSGMVLTTFSHALKDPFRVRAVTFFNSPLWMWYDIINGSVSGVANEIVCMASILLAIVRVDIPNIKKKKREKELQK